MSTRAIEFIETRTIVTETCFQCGVLFAMDEAFKRDRLRLGDAFYCVNGHGQIYTGESEADKLRREIGSLKADRSFWQDEAERQKRAATAVKGLLTRARNRAAAGVCQECHRTFVNVARHMQNKHGAHNEGMVEGETER